MEINLTDIESKALFELTARQAQTLQQILNKLHEAIQGPQLEQKSNDKKK